MSSAVSTNGSTGDRGAPSAVWSPDTIADIRARAELGRYVMGAFSTKRSLPNLDDLTFIPCTLSRLPLEGYRERCSTATRLGGQFGATPVPSASRTSSTP